MQETNNVMKQFNDERIAKFNLVGALWMTTGAKDEGLNGRE